MTYRAPVADIAFALKHAAGLKAALAEGLYSDLDEDMVDQVLEEAGRFAGEVIAHFDSGLILDDRFDLEIVGEEASLFVSDPWHCLSPRIELRRAHTTEVIEVAPGNPYGLEADNLAAAIRGEGVPRLGRADAEGQARAIEALYASADSGAPVSLPR